MSVDHKLTPAIRQEVSPEISNNLLEITRDFLIHASQWEYVYTKAQLSNTLDVCAFAGNRDEWKYIKSRLLGKKRAFDDLYLNLDHNHQYLILEHWGIIRKLDDTMRDELSAYMEKMNSDDVNTHMKAVFGCLPVIFQYFNNLLTFFYNHGIEEQPAHGVLLDKTTLPVKKEHCFGCSKHWIKYILKQPTSAGFGILKQLLQFYPLKTLVKDAVITPEPASARVIAITSIDQHEDSPYNNDRHERDYDDID